MAAKNDSGGKQGGGLVPTLVAIGLALVFGLGSGFGAVTLFAPTLGPSSDAAPSASAGALKKPGVESGVADQPEEAEVEGAQTAEAEETEVVAIDPADIDYAALPPVIVNLREPSQVWLRLEGGITYAKSGEKKSELLVAESAQQIAQFIKTLSLADIEGPDGMQFLQEDVNGIVKALSNGQVDQVLVTGLVVE
jgi:flagellar protein FliL